MSILVTGGNGFLGAEILKQLCERQKAEKTYTEIRTTVRDPDSPKNAFLKDQSIFPGLVLYKADLAVDGSFDEACKGVKHVLHVASPFNFSAKDPQKDLVEPAIQGTENVMKASEKAGTVEKIVFTSSVAALCDFELLKPDQKIDETTWNTTSTTKSAPSGYRLSKALAERKLWEYNEKWQKEGKKIDVISINPSAIVGSQYGEIKSENDLGQSNRWVYSVLSREWKAYKAGASWVSCPDVARCHLLALERGIPGSRYPTTSANKFWGDLNQIAAKVYPSLNVITEWDEDIKSPGARGFFPNIDNSKTIKDLGITFETPEQMIKDCNWVKILFKL